MSEEKRQSISEKKGLTRREFLKSIGAALAGVSIEQNPALRGLSEPFVFQAPFTREGEKKGEWTRKEIFKRPLEFIDYFCDRMVEVVGKDSLDSEQQIFLNNFSLKYASSDAQNSVKYHRHNLETGYRLYGDRINKILDKIEASGEETQFIFGSYLDSLSLFWRPMLSLYEKSKGEKSEEFAIADAINLSTLSASRFNMLTAHETYGKQKAAFVEMGKRMVEESDLDENIKVVWESLIRYRKLAEVEGERAHTKKEFEFFKAWIEKHKEYLPSAFIGFGNIDIGHVRRGGYYAMGHGGSEVRARGDFFYMLDAAKDIELIKKRKGLDESEKQFWIDNLNYASQLAADDASIVLLHELAHRVDPQNLLFNFFYFHPEDHLSYIEAYTDMLLSFFEYVDGDLKRNIKPLSGKEIEQWFYDPISPKIFGIDEIVSDQNLADFESEIDQLLETLSLFENDDPVQKFMKEAGMDWFFKEEGEDLINWKLRVASPSEGYLVRFYNNFLYTHQHAPRGIGLGIETQFSSFKGITKSHLEEMKQIVRETYTSGQPQWVKNSIINSILEMKSLYLFATYVFLRHGVREEVKSPDIRHWANYRNLEKKIIDHLIHCMAGPVDEYLPLAPDFPLTLHVAPMSLVKSSINQSNLFRQEDSSLYFPRTTQMINQLNRYSAVISDKRAKMWGADVSKGAESGQESEVYTQLAFDITRNLLGLPDLPPYSYVPSLG